MSTKTKNLSLPAGYHLANDLFLMKPYANPRNQPNSWVPVSQWKKRRSPQSRHAIRHLTAFYGAEVDIWASGWRWTWEESDEPQRHSFYRKIY